MQFWSQVRLLLWKIWLMKKRRPLGTMCEIFIPVLLVSLLILIREEVDVEVQEQSYGASIPIVSVLNLISLPTTLENQNICKRGELAKYIGVAPDTAETREFLNKLEEFYEDTLEKSFFDYYGWDYLTSDPANFRDLLILIEDVSGNDIDGILDDLGLDVLSDESIELIIELLDLTIFSLGPEDFQDFYDFLTEFELDDFLDSLENLTITFNVTDAAAIQTLDEFLNETTVGDFLDFFNVTLDEIEDTFNIDDPDITLNTTVVSLLNDIAEDLFNLTWEDVLSVLDLSYIETTCVNITDVNNYTLPWDKNDTSLYGSNVTDVITLCNNETINQFEVTVNVEDFLTIYYDILTLTNNTEIDLDDISISDLYDLLNDALTEEVIEDAFGINITQQDVDTLDEFVQINGNITLAQLLDDINEILEELPIAEAIRLLGNLSSNLTLTDFSDALYDIGLELLEDTLGISAEEAEFILEFFSAPDAPECLQNGSGNTFQDIFMFFDSSSDMSDYVTSDKYGNSKNPVLAAGLVFGEINVTAAKFDYTLRFNQSQVSDTTAPYVDRYGRSPASLTAQSLWDYYESGFLGWQNAIDLTILRMVDQQGGEDYKYGIHQFPFEPYRDDSFWPILKRLLPMFLIIAFSYPFCIICKTIVEEKSLRLKEGFKILGGSNTAYLLSYVIAYIFIFTITTALLTMVLSSIFVKSDGFIIFLLIFIFGLNMVALSMLIASLFDQPRLSSVIAWVSFLTLFFVYRFVEDAPDESAKNAVCISGPACFGLALLQVAEYEEYEIGIVWSNVSEYNELTYFRLSTAFWWMSFDFFLYLFLMFYCDRVVPSKYGVRRPFYRPFAFMDRWFESSDGSQSGMEEKIFDKEDKQHKDMVAHNIEKVDRTMLGDPLIELKKLTKVYQTSSNTQKVAVNRLELEMFKNQVFCLLGHNGAGKSTTCSMLTGLTAVTSGDAVVAGYSIVSNLKDARKQIGLCPQHDLLFPRLSVWEHLQFYGKLNGMQGKELDDLCHDLLNKIQLDGKINFQASQLSGGQKRKLSVCIALIGRTSVVILDEPTTGMDPYARRRTWELIREYKKNRCLILTTHFMDEAEVLGDRIGIMAHGKLMCCGSPFFLKQNYNVGYALTLSLSHPCTVSDVDHLSQQLRKQLQDDNVRLIGYAANELTLRISFDNNPKLPSLFRFLDESKDSLSITKYGISATTLEEVFRMINSSQIFDKQEESMSVSRTFDNSNQSLGSNSSDITNIANPKHGQRNGKKKRYEPINLSHSHQQMDAIAATAIQDRTVSVDASHADGAETETSTVAVTRETSVEAESSAAMPKKGTDGAQSVEMQGLGAISLRPTNSVTVESEEKTHGGGAGAAAAVVAAQTSSPTVPETPSHGPVTHDESEQDPSRKASFLGGYDGVKKNEFLSEFYSNNEALSANLGGLPVWRIYGKHVYSVVWKRVKNAKRDWKTFICQIFIPSLFVLFGLWFIDIQWWEKQPDYVFKTSDWIEDTGDITLDNDAHKLVIPFNGYNNESDRVSYYQQGGSPFEAVLMTYDMDVDSDGNANPTFQSYLEETGVTPYQSVGGTTAFNYFGLPEEFNFLLPEWQDYLFDTRFDNETSHYVSLYMMQYLDPNLIMIGANASAYHAVPTGMNLASKTMVKTLQLLKAGASSNLSYADLAANETLSRLASEADIITHSHPFERTQQQDAIIDSVNAFFTAIILAIGLSFVPAAYITLLVSERVNMIKHQQLVSGMGLVAYWTGNFIYDFFAMLMPAICIVLLVIIFDSSIFIEGEALFATFLVTMMYGAAIIPFTYLLSFFFKSPGSAQALMLLLYLAASVIMMIAAWVMDVIEDESLNDLNATLKIVYRFFPSYLMSEAFRGISTRDVVFLWGEELGVYEWEVSGRNLVYLALEMVGYLTLVIVLDFLGKSPLLIKWINGHGLHLNQHRGKFELEKDQLDSDVLAEQERLRSNRDAGRSEDPIELHGLRKVYPGAWNRPPTVAVQGLWYSVKKGEIFGFLGLNGAGKSTTLSMLSGVFPSSLGGAYLEGMNINTQQQAIRRLLGFCPQFSALFDKLTVREHLLFYSQIKGLQQGEKLNEIIKILMKDLSLWIYRDTQAGQLSGGNQRKLSVGIALIGNPPIVLMDEPSSGMDPVSRRLLWDFISNTMAGRSVILTTHSMEECEALCNRVGIMVNGQLACLGDSTHLKNKFGVGYQLDIKYNTNDNASHDISPISEDTGEENEKTAGVGMQSKLDATRKEFIQLFGVENVELVENYGSSARFQVGKDESLADVFEMVENIKDQCKIDSYAVSQTSLEQIFVRFAKKQSDEEQDMKSYNDKRSCIEKGLACGVSLCVVD